MGQSISQTKIVIAGAGYGGLHVAQRLGPWLRRHHGVEGKLVDSHDYHQLITELPRVATGTRSGEQVEVDLNSIIGRHITFVRSTVTGLNMADHQLLTADGPLAYDWLVLALGSRPNDFNIPGLAERVLYPYSSHSARDVWEAVSENVERAAKTQDPKEQARLMTVVIGGGGATGVELAAAFAEELPDLARQNGAPPQLVHVTLVEAGHTILAGSSPELMARAERVLRELGVEVRTNAAVAEATEQGFRLKSGELVEGGVFVWAGGVKATDVVHGLGLPIGYNGRIKVDEYLRALDHPNIFVAGDLASVIDSESGHVLPPLAQIAIEEGDTVVHNLEASIEGRPLEPFHFRNKGFVVSLGNSQGVADVAGRTIGGRVAHTLKDAIEWEYRQSVRYLRGRGAA